MKFILFTKVLRNLDVRQLIDLAPCVGADGYELTVRDGYPTHPGNMADELPRAADAIRTAGLDVPMAAGPSELQNPALPVAEDIARACGRAGVPILRLPSFRYEPGTDFDAELDRVRGILSRWSEIAGEHGIVAVYHMHSGALGSSGGTLNRMLEGVGPHVRVNLDPAHILVDGEPFTIALAQVARRLTAVALKDYLLFRGEKNGHGLDRRKAVPAGEGMVDWTNARDELRRIGFDGPMCVHLECLPLEQWTEDAIRREIRFFRELFEGSTEAQP